MLDKRINKADDLSSGKASVFVLAAGCMWGLMGLLVRSLGAVGIAAMEVCFIRSVVTFVSLLAGILLFCPKALQIKWKDIWCFIGTGACSVTFFNFCYFKTMTLTSLSVAAVLLYTAPAFVMLMSAVLFSEKLSIQKLAALGFAFIGCAFVSGIAGGAGRLSASGILYGLLAGFGYALYSIFGRYALEKGYSSLTISFYTFLCSVVCTFFLADKGSVVSALSGNGMLVFRTVILVLLVTLLPYLSYTKGLKGMENGTASVLASIEPVVATLVGVFVYRETLNIWNIIGMCMVLDSIILINVKYDGKKFTKK
ncbi:MAG: EamA family transporter [Lachnospiraceae bacterium]|nr:EamA family transporter [Lachnospiraceae bacterium]